MILPPPRSTLFPYTTLFRSTYFLKKDTPVTATEKKPKPNFKDYIAFVRNSNPTYKRMLLGFFLLALLNGSDMFLLLRRSEEHTSELQSLAYLVCRLLLEKKN